MSITKKTDSRGRVRYQVYVTRPGTGSKMYVATFDRRKDAVEAEIEAKRRLRLGERLKPREEIAFDDLAAKWLSSLTSIRPSTREDYHKAVRRVRPYIGRRLVSSLTRRDIDALIAGLSGEFSPSTVRKSITITKMILRTGMDWDYLDKLPTGGSRLSLPKVQRRRFRPLTPEQVARLIDSAPEYWRPWFVLMATSGLRRAESWGLRLGDLDLERGVLHVRQQLIGSRLCDLKTEAAQRTIPLPPSTVAALSAYLDHRPVATSDLLFVTEEGNVVDGSNFYSRIWVPTREAAGLPDLRIHDMRHHTASVLLSQGRSVRYVMNFMGHSTAAVLLDVYAHVLPGEDDAAAADLERWLGGEYQAEYAA